MRNKQGTDTGSGIMRIKEALRDYIEEVSMEFIKKKKENPCPE